MGFHRTNFFALSDDVLFLTNNNAEVQPRSQKPWKRGWRKFKVVISLRVLVLDSSGFQLSEVKPKPNKLDTTTQPISNRSNTKTKTKVIA